MLLNILISLLIVFLCLTLREFWMYTKLEFQIFKKFPSDKVYLFIGNLKDILWLNAENLFVYGRKSAFKYKETYANWISGILSLNIIRAKDVEVILSSSKCTNKSFIYNFLHSFMGTGLLTSAGKKWQQRRKILTPAFHFFILQHQFHKIFQEETNSFVENIKNKKDKKVFLQSELSRFTLNTICETAMGVKLSTIGEPDNYRKNIHELGTILVNRLIKPWLQTEFGCWVFGVQSKMNKLLVPIHNFTTSVIKERRQLFNNNTISVDFTDDENIYMTRKSRYAMLDTLLAAEANGEPIDDAGIREEVDTFMFEGHDTTSSGLTFILFCIAENQDVQQKLYQEIRESFMRNSTNDLTMTELNKLNYLDRVIKEALRLFPPVTFISRGLSEEIPFKNDIVLPPETLVHIHIYDIHRDPEYYPQPEKFDPDRFLSENCANRHPYAYIPFSAGPRNCIGQKFALLEIKTIITNIIFNFHLEQITKREELIMIADLVLRTKNPIYVKFNLRENI